MLSTLARAGEAPDFFPQVVALFVASAVIAYVGFRFGLVPIVGFLLAGIVIGPSGFGLVTDPEIINAAAEIGVVLLLFTIGIEFSLERLARIARLIFVGGGLQVGLTIGVVALVCLGIGTGWRDALFTGCLIALSSTAIVMKLLSDQGDTNNPAGQGALGVLVFQDLAVVAMVLMVPMMGTTNTGGLAAIGQALLSATVIIVVILLLARRVMPAMLDAVARTCSREIFLLFVIAVCLGTAYVTSLFGLSLALGAFLAGLLVSESRFGQQALGDILPIQIVFSAAFFISVGLLFDIGFMLARWPLVLAAIAGVLLIKTLATTVSLKALGYGAGAALNVGLLLAQIGEFSFVLESVGRQAGLNPFGLVEGGSETFIAVTVLLMAGTPFLAQLGRAAEGRLDQKQSRQAAPSVAPEQHGFNDLEQHVVIAGYGLYGRWLAATFKQSNTPFGIVTLSPDGALEAERDGYRVLRGDYANPYIIGLANVRAARLLVIPDDEPGMAHRVTATVRANFPALPIMVRTRRKADVHELRQAGATEVVADEYHAIKALLGLITASAGPAASQARAAQAPGLEEPADLGVQAAAGDGAAPDVGPSGSVIQLDDAQRRSPQCQHLEWAQAVVPDNIFVCAECARLGDSWVHLRVCLTCGSVGCCDDSKNQHARRHFEASGHPLIKSLEPGEAWAYCFVDDVSL